MTISDSGPQSLSGSAWWVMRAFRSSGPTGETDQSPMG